MIRFVVPFALAAAMFVPPALAQTPTASADKGQRPNACSILTREEVKKIMQWNAVFDKQKETEEPFGSGSVCFYPGVHVFVGTRWASDIESARRRGPVTPVAGIGDEAFLHANGSSFAELYIRVGDRRLHVQRGIPFTETFESVKPSLIALGKALAAKLR